MTPASWALQQAVFAVLATSAAVRALAGERVFDAVPRGAAFPYVVLGDAVETAAGTATDDASEHRLVVRAWSRAGGHRESKLLARAICEALDGAVLDLDGHTLIDLRLREAEYVREHDGATFRAALTFRAITEPN
ncbi:MAG: DUF3168 domain-containing protein [Alphaproteobacteria bacterium]|nr:DUF3168 domain-containing protein [Alphaproteobacteria bacterium]